MTARRAVIDGLIVVAALALLARPYLLPEPKDRPKIPRGRLLASAPLFGWQTNADDVYTTVTVTLSNAGPIDLEWVIDWFDCRAMDQLAQPESYGPLPGSTNLRSRAVGYQQALGGFARLFEVRGSVFFGFWRARMYSALRG